MFYGKEITDRILTTENTESGPFGQIILSSRNIEFQFPELSHFI